MNDDGSVEWYVNKMAEIERECGDVESIPSHIKESILNYVKYGWEPGGFVTSCLANNLWRAVQTADVYNITKLRAITYFIYEHVPPQACGAYHKVEKYCRDKQQEIKEQQEEGRAENGN